MFFFLWKAIPKKMITNIKNGFIGACDKIEKLSCEITILKKADVRMKTITSEFPITMILRAAFLIYRVFVQRHL